MSKQEKTLGGVGVVGMAVMGRNLALNIESRGYSVAIFNRTRETTQEVIEENIGKSLIPHYTI
ncbi:MAG: NAD(P)-binding domain-containing protein, partial [Candidatus Regiella insecticola]|nr:NAD(P)-binding domain-containing protein [Candidatus Regiella insecticola]